MSGNCRHDEKFDTRRTSHGYSKEPKAMIKQCAPDNNPFWEDGHNPLSSKGN